MKLKLLPAPFILLFSMCAFAQHPNKTFAITGNGDFLWMNIRQIDISTGLVTKYIFEKGVTKFSMLDVAKCNGKSIPGCAVRYAC